MSADARTLPEELVGQLADGGRLVVPVAGTMKMVVRTGGDRVVSEHGSYLFVPLLTPSDVTG